MQMRPEKKTTIALYSHRSMKKYTWWESRAPGEMPGSVGTRSKSRYQYIITNGQNQDK